MDRRKPFPWLRILVHLLGWLPLGILAYLWFADKLTINPIQDVEQRLGRIAVYWLVGALSVTPLYTLTGWRDLPSRRRATGLYAFMYVNLHLLIFLGVDYGFVFSQIFPLIFGKVYLLVGLLSLLLLIPLAATSFDYFKRKMGKNWKRLHWLVYPAVVTAILHYALAKKGDIFSLQGDILAPFLWGLLTLFLLGLRIPPVRRWVSLTRRKVENWVRQKKISHKSDKADLQVKEKGRI